MPGRVRAPRNRRKGASSGRGRRTSKTRRGNSDFFDQVVGGVTSAASSYGSGGGGKKHPGRNTFGEKAAARARRQGRQAAALRSAAASATDASAIGLSATGNVSRSIAERAVAGGIAGLIDEDFSADVRRTIYGTENPNALQLALAAPIPAGRAVSGVAKAIQAIRAAGQGAKAAQAGVRGAEAAQAGARAATAARGGERAAEAAAAGGRATETAADAASAISRADNAPSWLSRAKDAPLRAQQSIGARSAARQAARTGALRKLAGKGPRGAQAKGGLIGHASGQAAGGAVLAASPVVAQMASSPTGQEIVAAAPQVPWNLGRALIEDPGGTLSQSGQSLRDTLLGLPQSFYELAAGGVEAAQGDTSRIEELGNTMAADYSARYGPALEGDWGQFRENVQSGYTIDTPEGPIEAPGGLTPFALDAAIAAPPVGRAAGALARGGRLGAKVEGFATRARPALRVGAGDDAVVNQQVADNLGVVAAQRFLDRRRGRAGDRRAENGAGIQAREGEVVPLRQGGRIRRRAGQQQGRAFLSMVNEQAREIAQGARRDIKDLNKDERAALSYAISLGIDTPDAAKKWLSERESQITTARESGNTILGDRSAPKSMDEIPGMRALAENAEGAFTPRMAEAAQALRARERRLSEIDPGLDPEQARTRRYQDQGRMLDVERGEGESVSAWIGRVQEKAQKEGLASPGYFAAEMKAKIGDYALGGNRLRATALVKRNRGKVFEAGLRQTDPEVAIRGLSRNIKRRHQWRMVTDAIHTEAFSWSLPSKAEAGQKAVGEAVGMDPKVGRSIPQLLMEAERRGIDPENISFVSPSKLRAAERALTNEDTTRDVNRGVGEATVDLDDDSLGSALAEAKVDGARAAQKAGDYEDAQGYVAVPKELADELEQRVRANNLFGRASEIATQKASRIILGANPPWLAFQMISNGALSILGGAGPTTWIRAQRWWKGLSEEERIAIEPYIGAGHFTTDVRSTKLGASGKNLRLGLNHVVNAYGALKQTPAWQKAHRANPLDAMFRLDNAQNNFFRRAILYERFRREAYGRMNKNASVMMGLQDRIVNAMKLDPEGQIKWLRENTDALERHAKAVDDFLGDYTNFTARERNILKRHVLFYGYLRFSLRFTFATMPLKHPVMTGVIGQLSRLSTAQIRDMLGGTNLPFALGAIYTRDGQKVIDLGKANPVMNVLTSATDPRQVAGILSPWMSMAASQAFRRDLFTGKDWLVQGESTARRYLPIGPVERGRIALNQVFNMSWLTRTAGEATAGGSPQGADTLFFDPRPTQYAPGGEAQQRAAERAGRWQSKSFLDHAQEAAFPYLPRPSEDIKATVEGLQQARESELERIGGSSSSSSSTSSGSSTPSWMGGGSSSGSSSSGSSTPSWMGG